MTALDSVITQVCSPEDFVNNNILFSIPSYQRPYVWSDEAIKSLFDDLYSAYQNIDDDNQSSHYFVGTILTAKNTDDIYELIDGQQRTTTLMLLALACKKKGINTELINLISAKSTNDKLQLRLRFKIRNQVEAYLGHMAGITEYDNKFPGESEVDQNPYLKRLAGGLATFENLLDQIGEKVDLQDKAFEQCDFANFVYKNMRMVNNQIPRTTDLNQLFATMNNSGVQLEQSDILKSLLFKDIKTDKATYNAIWLACENMDNYFERNVRQVFPLTNWRSLEPTDFNQFNSDIFLLKSKSEEIGIQTSSHGLTIAQISQLSIQTDKEKNGSFETEEKAEIYCKSIISFSQLLLHTFRIYLQKYKSEDFEPRFHSDQLINIFKPFIEEAFEQDIKEFVECLWQVRYAFDAKVVKWVEKVDEDEEQLILCSVNGSDSNGKYYFNRSPISHSNLSLLQMVRHFTADRNAQYWLTSFLGWTVNNPTCNDDEVLKQLESIDNKLSLSSIDQKSASFMLLSKDLGVYQSDPKIYLQEYLNEQLGVQFKHYWFQKLEYLLYKHRDIYFPNMTSQDTSKLSQYRIISRNSVEHVHPQNEEYDKQLNKGYLNCFGNLALLNVSQNSAYSNQDVAKKRIDFDRKNLFDSLKLKHIFDLMGNGLWEEEQITEHQEIMIELLMDHY